MTDTPHSEGQRRDTEANLQSLPGRTGQWRTVCPITGGNTMNIPKKHLNRINSALNSVAVAERLWSKACSSADRELWRKSGAEALDILDEYGIKPSAGIHVIFR